jgi:hypothetical protein
MCCGRQKVETQFIKVKRLRDGGGETKKSSNRERSETFKINSEGLRETEEEHWMIAILGERIFI